MSGVVENEVIPKVAAVEIRRPGQKSDAFFIASEPAAKGVDFLG